VNAAFHAGGRKHTENRANLGGSGRRALSLITLQGRADCRGLCAVYQSSINSRQTCTAPRRPIRNRITTATIRVAIQVMMVVSDARHSNLASSLICALRTFEMGQLFTACHAMVSKVSRLRFGTFARKIKAEQLMR
jgi:hypothetical protein